MLSSLVVEEEEEEDEFAESLVKRVVPRSGLLVETPVPKRDSGETSARKGVLERLFKLSSIGQTEKKLRTERIGVKRTESREGISFRQRMGLVRRAGDERGNVGMLEWRAAFKDDTPRTKTVERPSPRRFPSKARKRRRFDIPPITKTGTTKKKATSKTLSPHEIRAKEEREVKAVPSSSLNSLIPRTKKIPQRQTLMNSPFQSTTPLARPWLDSLLIVGFRVCSFVNRRQSHWEMKVMMNWQCR
jgi:hypothetical protein